MMTRSFVIWALLIAAVEPATAAPEDVARKAAAIQRNTPSEWVVTEQPGAVMLETAVGPWPLARYCLDEIAQERSRTIERELVDALATARNPSNELRWEVHFSIVGASDEVEIPRGAEWRDQRCGEMPFNVAELKLVGGAHARLGAMRALAAWTIVARAWHAVEGRVPRAVILNPFLIEPAPQPGDALISSGRDRRPGERTATIRAFLRLAPVAPSPPVTQAPSIVPPPPVAPPPATVPVEPAAKPSVERRDISPAAVVAGRLTSPGPLDAPAPLRDDQRRWRIPTAIALFGAGILGVGAGVYSLYRADQRRSDAIRETDPQEIDFLKDQGDLHETIGTWTIFPGAAMLLTGAGLIIWERLERR